MNFDQHHNTFLFEYTDKTHDSFLIELEKQLGFEYDNQSIHLPTTVGSGYISNHKLEEGLFVRSLNLILNVDFPFRRVVPEQSEKFFHLYYFLEKGNFEFSLDEESLKPESFGNTIFISNDIAINGVFKAGSKISAVIVLFTSAWLEKNKMDQTEKLKIFFDSINKKSKPTFLLNDMSISDYETAKKIHQGINVDNLESFKVRLGCLNLIGSFFNGLEERMYLKLNKTRSAHFLEMIKVEKRIAEYLETTLPSIKVLAKEFNLSESTLKRHFKVVYGKHIYEYYLYKKMVLAKTILLQEEQLSIAQVAYSLGYEKASSMSVAFKKVHGILPSTIKVPKHMNAV